MDKKFTKSQIREQERQKLVNELRMLRKEYQIIKEKNDELKETVCNYEDRVRRMQECIKPEAEHLKRFHDMTDAYISMIDRFFIL